MRVSVLHIDECPNWKAVWERLAALADEEGFELRRHTIRSPDDPAAGHFGGSPTILLDGRDPFASGSAPAGLTCRIYDTPEGPRGAPTTEQLRAAIRHAGGSRSTRDLGDETPRR